MKTSARLLRWSVLTTLLTLLLQAQSVGQTSNQTTARIAALSVTASFDHGDKNDRYVSSWTGVLSCQLLKSTGAGKSHEMIFPLGLGQNPSSLNILWATGSQTGKMNTTGPVPVSLVNDDAEPSDVQAWTLFKKVKDPSLVIPLAASGEGTNEYTNADEVTGKIVAWITDKNGTACLELALLSIPAKSILLKSLPDRLGEPTMELTIQSMQLSDFNDDTWERIIENGNGHINLPTDASDAECRSFAARTQMGRVEGARALVRLQNSILESYRSGEIGAGEVVQIIGDLDASRISRSDNDAGQSAAALIQTYKTLNKLAGEGKIKQQDSRIVLELNKKLISRPASSTPSMGRRIPPPPGTPGGPEVTYHVRQDGGIGIADGTLSHPYRSISDAYDAAKALDSRQVELVVDAGYYIEPLMLDRNTILRAAPGCRPVITSTITCTRALHLDITGFALIGAPSPGALQVLVPGSSVSIVDVEVRDAHRYGIYQRGGEIELRAVTVRDTRREAGQIEYGSGVVLQEGVQAMLSSVTLNDNESSGIIIRGRDSRLFGVDVTLQRNKLHTDFYSEAARSEMLTGAFLVADHAVADLQTLRMDENEFEGLGVYGNAEATVDNATVTHSRSIRVSSGDGGTRSYGGLGIRAKDGGHITMQNFLVSHCDLIGVAVHPAGEIDLHVGEVSFNPAGVHLLESFDINRLFDAVSYINNERNLDTSILPIPEPSTGGLD